MIDAPWTQRDDLHAMLAAIDPQGDACRYVGGAVRDSLLGIAASDIDIATRLLPENTMRLLDAAGIKAVPTGIAHGTVTAVLPLGSVEITTLRRDIATDGRHAEVAFTDDWREDAARRDFTINALFADPRTLAITDYFGGLGDLAARRVRFIGDASERILEDHLRILRYFRFFARFSGTADAVALKACTTHAARLKALSRERIARELLLMLGSADPAGAAQLMLEAGIWSVILPEMADNALAMLDRLLVRETQVDAKPDSLLRLAALLPGDAAGAEHMASRLRLSKAQRITLAAYVRCWPDNPDARRVAASDQNPQLTPGWLLLRAPDAVFSAEWPRLQGWTVPVFPLAGRDILAMGVSAGPAVARVLAQTRATWVAEGFPDEARVLAIATSLAVKG
ncbi:CCA tRNA nucleotidyltransferase [Blastomonas sp.]|uniref:CCA tRNA nucleotidyltransferase n=1 Tax=Blastomonas sp. TaxID=1909299 RepID=UPI003593A911